MTKRRSRTEGRSTGRVTRNRDFIEALAHATPNDACKLARLANPDQTNAIGEVAYNVLHGSFPIRRHQKATMRKHRCALRRLANPELPVKRRQKVLQQKGGFIGTVLRTLGRVILPTLLESVFPAQTTAQASTTGGV